MQGYFEYNLFGSKEELQEVLTLIKNISENKVNHSYLNEQITNDLLKFNHGISKYLYSNDNNTHILSFNTKENIDTKCISFEFNEMPYILSNSFINLKIEGLGYYLDCPPYENFISDRGNSNYTIKYMPINVTITKDNLNKEQKIGEYKCPLCNSLQNCKLSNLDEYTCDITTKCKYCDTVIVCDFDFNIKDLI